MFAFPNSSAMDATAGSGGPSTILPQIVTGNQPAIAAHSSSLLSTATTLTSMVSEFTQAAQSLSNVWSGQASETAVKKITDSLNAFTKIIQVIQNGAKLLQVSGTLVQAAQTGYTSVVSATNPTVASLMSNPWTYSAAVALSTSTSAALRGFITGVQGMLSGTSAVQLLQEVAALAQIAQTIEQLMNGSGAAASTPSTAPSNQTIAATPVTTPNDIPNIASATGTQAAQGIGVGQAAIPQQYLDPTQSTTGTGQLAGAGLSATNGYGIPSAGGTTTTATTTAATTPTNLGMTPTVGATPTTGQLAGAGLSATNGYGIPSASGTTAPAGTTPTNLGMTPTVGTTPVTPVTPTMPTLPTTGQLAGAGLSATNGYGIPGASGATAPTNLGMTPTVGTTPTNLGMTPTVGTTPTNLGMTPTVGTTPGTGYIGTPNDMMAVNPAGGATSGLTPSIDPSNSWIAVDPSQQAAAAGAGVAPTAPTAAVPAGTGQDVSVTTTDGGITTTVEVPAGQAANIHLDMTVNSDHVAETLNIGADGSVSVS